MNFLKNVHERVWIGIFCLVSALIPLLICSKSSFLYPFNDWPDVNIFFTMGKGMVHGMVPYVDLIDHKGPYLYALAAISYLLSKDTFYGYFVFEIVSMFFFLYYSHKIIVLYSGRKALWVLPLLSAAVVSAKSFVHGGSTEELCLGIFAYAIYSLLVFLRGESGRHMATRVLVVNAVWAGVLLWSKFTLLGLYIGWMLTVLFVYLMQKDYKAMLKSAGIFLGTMLATMIPWLIYFGWHHAIGDWLQGYLWNNIFGYTSGDSVSLWDRLSLAVMNALRSLKDKGNWSYSLWVIVGGMLYVFMPLKKVSAAEKEAVLLMGAGMALGIFIGGTKHDYYGLPMAAFSVFGAVALVCLAGKTAEHFLPEKCRRNTGGILAVLILIIAAVEGYLLSPNTYLLWVEREEMPQYRFAEHIRASDDTTLLNYAFLDGGFYTVLDVDPVTKYFCTINMNRNAVLAEQTGYVEEQRTHWLVTWKAFEMPEEELKQLPVVSEYYNLVDYQYFFFEGDMRTYALYEKK